MKKLYVSATLYYGYEIEVPEEKLNDETFNLCDYANEMDPLEPKGINRATCEWYTNSIFDEKGEEYYCG